MPGLVIGDAAALLRGGDAGTLLQASHDAIHSIHKVLLLHEPFAATCSDKRGFVTDVGDVSTGEARSLPSKEVGVDRGIYFDRAEVYVEDLLALIQVGQLHVDLPIETPSTQQSLVEHIGAVRSRQNDHATVRSEAVHLREELVKGTFTFIVTCHVHVLPTRTPHSIDLINKDDARRLLLSLPKQVADT